MESKTKKKIALGVFGVFIIALMVLFGMYDLQISTAIVQEENPVGLWLEFFGTLVGPFIFIFSGMVGFVYAQKSPLLKARRFRMALCVISCLIGLVYCTTLYIDAKLVAGIICGIITIIALFVWGFYLEGKTASSLKNLCYIAIISLIYLLAVLAFINLIKICWGRVRFREMQDIAEFSAWYIPQGLNGHRSFPSGHTANAATLYVLTLFAPLCKNKITKSLCYIIPIAWIVVMAGSRVLVGAHYCSDVLFGALISIALFYISKQVVFMVYKKALEKAKKVKKSEATEA